MKNKIEALPLDYLIKSQNINSSVNSLRMLPSSLLSKYVRLSFKLSQGIHPQALGAIKVRSISGFYRFKLSYKYRVLIGIINGEWGSYGIYKRKSFDGIINKKSLINKKTFL